MIAFDASAGGSAASTNNLTVAMTVGSGSNRALVVAVTGASSDLVTSATFNGVAMTLVNKTTPMDGSRYLYAFYLAAPASGAHNIVVSASGTSDFILAAAASYTGVSQSGQPEVNHPNEGLTNVLTTLTNNAWTVLAAKNEAGNAVAGSGSTKRGGDGFGGDITCVFDSNGPVTPAGSNSMAFGPSGAFNSSSIMLSLAPAVGGGSSLDSTAELADATNTTLTMEATPTGGTAPYNYQWYRSTTANFTPGAGNLLSGATSAMLLDSTGLSGGNVIYFYICRVGDSAAGSVDTPQIAGALKTEALVIGGIGDSIMAGDGLEEGEDPLIRCGEILEKFVSHKLVTVVNQAINGLATSDWLPGNSSLTGAKAAFASAGVTHVVVMLGANDSAAVHLVPASTYGTNLSSICEDLVGSGYKVILNYPTYVPAGANSGATTAASVALAESYQGQIDALVDGVGVLRGDRLAPAYFADHLDEYQENLTHVTVDGARSLGQLWAQAGAVAIAGRSYGFIFA